ncbi:MAG: FprA family A-type flavoprotein, partial [Bacteroidetes bacterium]|nr:FprA family A-type flavoprotein [Bacteroidota bacterium]
NASNNHLSYILSEAFLNQGIIVGAPTYNGEIFPWVDFALQMFVRFDIRNRYTGMFGSKTWSSGITQKMVDRIGSLNWELVHDPFENLCAPTETEFQLASSMADKMAQILKTDNKSIPD